MPRPSRQGTEVFHTIETTNPQMNAPLCRDCKGNAYSSRLLGLVPRLRDGQSSDRRRTLLVRGSARANSRRLPVWSRRRWEECFWAACSACRCGFPMMARRNSPSRIRRSAFTANVLSARVWSRTTLRWFARYPLAEPDLNHIPSIATTDPGRRAATAWAMPSIVTSS